MLSDRGYLSNESVVQVKRANTQNTCNIPRLGGLPAIVPLHLALVAIKLVVGTANKLTLPAADLVAERGGATMLRRHLNHSLPAGLTLQMAKGPETQTRDVFANRTPLLPLIIALAKCSAFSAKPPERILYFELLFEHSTPKINIGLDLIKDNDIMNFTVKRR